MQATLIYTPVLTCGHLKGQGHGIDSVKCGGTSFRVADGPTGRRLRCTSCNARADSAVCSCSHGYGAHAAGGCMGVLDGGSLCECNLRGGR